MIELLAGVPQVRRARGYRLYDTRGRRYLDLWQLGGRALLGHRPGRLTTTLKNVISTGLVADLPSAYTGRLERALLRRFPSYPTFRLAAGLEGALEMASLALGRTVERREICDPALGPPEGAAGPALWRPFLPEGLDPLGWRPPPRVLLPVLPFAMAGAPMVLGLAGAAPPGLPPSRELSPVLLAGAAAALQQLQRHRRPGWFREDLLAGAAGWSQQGVYVVARFPRERYPAVFRGFLEHGVLLAPSFPGPSILPGEASPGELQKMIGLFHQFPGE